MNLIGRIFKRDQAIIKEAQILLPDEMPNPQSVDDYLRRGWAFHARDDEERAADDFRKAMSLDPKSVDSFFGLGMALKALGSEKEAVEAFRKAANLIEEGVIEDPDRAEMLHRLALGHINELTEGDWNLESQIWRRER